jgi:hypothetical protein
MSYQAMNWAAESRCGSAGLKALLLCLANHADPEGVCWPSQKLISFETEMSVATVQRGLARLVALGLLTVEPLVVPKRGKVGNRYKLAMAEPPQAAAEAAPEVPEPMPQNAVSAPMQQNEGSPRNCTAMRAAETASVLFPENHHVEPPVVTGSTLSASQKATSLPAGPDWQKLVWVDDMQQLAKLAGCSLKRAKMRIAGLIRDHGHELAAIHEAFVKTIEAGPAGDPFNYASALLTKAKRNDRWVP